MPAATAFVDVIDRKRRGLALDDAEIEAFVRGATNGSLPDYQLAALLMAICCQGMDDRETATLTAAMATSGATLDLADVAPVIADKHSTGGVGDKTTLVVAPIVASAGVHVGKMSGRGLAHTGGTIDKLESIAGFSADLSAARFRAVLRQRRLVIAGQSADLAPADGVLYALRDATGTVQSLPLIASSIMSKKLAAGATAILLDVKVGRGAFMPTVDQATRLADLMVAIGRQAGRRVQATLTAMDQPLGRAIGNALEVAEAIETLSGHGPADFAALCRHEAASLLVLAGAAKDLADGEHLAGAVVASGAARETFAATVAAQGGDRRQIDDPARLPSVPVVHPVHSPRAGWVAALDALAVGRLVVQLGGGRQRKGDPIDHRVGLRLLAKVGDRVEVGQPLAHVHAASAAAAESAAQALMAGYAWSETPVAAPRLVLGER